jgi:hypothetical protein
MIGAALFVAAGWDCHLAQSIGFISPGRLAIVTMSGHLTNVVRPRLTPPSPGWWLEPFAG